MRMIRATSVANVDFFPQDAAMKVLAFTTQKGGSGKTALASSIAVAAAADGRNIVCLDLDPQKSLFDWYERREANTPPVDTCDPAELDKALVKLSKSKFDLVLLDLPGALDARVSLIYRHIDYAVVPVKPTHADIAAAIPTANHLKSVGKRFGFVLNQCFPGSPARSMDAAKALLKWSEVAPAMLSTRADYADAYGTAQGVTEFNPKGKAAQEINLLWAWLSSKIGE